MRGKQFERFVKWFLKTDPEWHSQVEEVWLWDEYPERWGPDCGIDLIFKHKNGKIWAVQAKCISPEDDIKKSEIDSFLSESSDARIDGRLLIASTDGIGRNSLQVIERQEKQVVCFLLDQFRHSEIGFPSSPDDLNKGRRKDPRTPRPHQIEAIDAVAEGFKNADRGQLLMACGTGKTLTALWIKERLRAKRSLVLVPSLSLLSQILREWTASASEPFDWICVCSDKSVAKKDRVEDDWISNTSEIGAPVTSDPKEIKEFLQRDNSQVVFSTYQSSQLISEAQEDSYVPEFDIAFADEAHRCAGKVSDAFGCVLDDEKIRSNKRLFQTATPRVLSKQIKHKAKEYEIEIASMDDHSVFGNILYQLNFSTAIKKDLLSDYRVVVVGVDDPMVEERIRNRDFLATSNAIETDAETLASHIALAKATKDYELNRVITFHSRIKSAREFAEQHNEIINWMPEADCPQGDISVNHVSGDMTSKERNKRIYQLKNLGKNERGILANARCLSEGVDVPTLNGIAFIDPRKSQVDIIQAVGRAIRKSEDKSYGTIVIPVYLADVENAEDEILASRFKDVWEIVLALKSQDDSLLKTIDRLRIEMGTRGQEYLENKELEKKVILDLPKKIRNDFSNSIRLLLIKNTSDDWLEKFGLLKDLYEKYGSAFVIRDDDTLNNWVKDQRVSYKKGIISQKRIDLLNSISFCWDIYAAKWFSKFNELKDFKLITGHLLVPMDNKQLYGWIGSQRRDLIADKLSKQKIELLNSINFIWDPKEEKWQIKYNQLKKYHLIYGHTNPPIDELYSSLANWCASQRKIYRKNELSQDRILLLENIDFNFNPLDKLWKDQFNELKKFKLLKGHTRPVKGKDDNTLSSWVFKQRRYYKHSKLSKDKIALLNSIDFVWDPEDEDWQKNYRDLKEFKKKYGHLKQKFGVFLYRWVRTQNLNYHEKKLLQNRIDLLESIEGWEWQVSD